MFLGSTPRAATTLHADLTGTAYLGGLNPLASRFESGGPHQRAAEGNWYTWIAQNDLLLRSNSEAAYQLPVTHAIRVYGVNVERTIRWVTVFAVARSAGRAFRYWFDYGTEGLDAEYHGPHEAIRAWPLRQGLRDGQDFVITMYEGADHNEASWRERLADPLRFLFAPLGPDGGGW